MELIQIDIYHAKLSCQNNCKKYIINYFTEKPPRSNFRQTLSKSPFYINI